jgi:hypothetical protein
VVISAVIVDQHDTFPAGLVWAAVIYIVGWAIVWRVRR